MPFRMAEEESVAVIKVIGVGGGGGNAINTMVESRLTGVQFIAANTDMQALEKSRADIRLQLGPGITKGMGAGADPEMGREAAQESYDDLMSVLKGALAALETDNIEPFVTTAPFSMRSTLPVPF